MPIDRPDAEVVHTCAGAMARHMATQLDILAVKDSPYDHQRHEEETLVPSVEFIQRCCQIVKLDYLDFACRSEHMSLLVDFARPSVERELTIHPRYLPSQDMRTLLDEGVFDFTVSLMKETASIDLNHHFQISNSTVPPSQRISYMWSIMFANAHWHRLADVVKEAISSGAITQLAGWHFTPSYSSSDGQYCRPSSLLPYIEWAKFL